jgi:hypothetical protein
MVAKQNIIKLHVHDVTLKQKCICSGRSNGSHSRRCLLQMMSLVSSDARVDVDNQYISISALRTDLTPSGSGNQVLMKRVG